MINMNAQGLCAITKYYVNGRGKAPTHSPFLSPFLISHLPVYHVKAYQQCLSTLSSPGTQKYKECVSSWQQKASWRLVQGEPGYLAGSTVVWAHVQRPQVPGTPWNPRQQHKWAPRGGASKTFTSCLALCTELQALWTRQSHWFLNKL